VRRLVAGGRVVGLCRQPPRRRPDKTHQPRGIDAQVRSEPGRCRVTTPDRTLFLTPQEARALVEAAQALGHNLAGPYGSRQGTEAGTGRARHYGDQCRCRHCSRWATRRRPRLTKGCGGCDHRVPIQREHHGAALLLDANLTG